MELLEEELITLTLLLIRKGKLDKKLRKTFICVLRKLFSCCGLKNIHEELIILNERIDLLKDKMKKPSPVQKITTI